MSANVAFLVMLSVVMPVLLVVEMLMQRWRFNHGITAEQFNESSKWGNSAHRVTFWIALTFGVILFLFALAKVTDDSMIAAWLSFVLCQPLFIIRHSMFTKAAQQQSSH